MAEHLPARPELQKDENGLWPGQQHPLDIPDFLRCASSTPRTQPSTKAQLRALVDRARAAERQRRYQSEILETTLEHSGVLPLLGQEPAR
ncbi:hypothetical protein [Bradyrhizobium sp. SZCCHNRI1002]|uniref:hypothetical protein n=1 Tax=Bradyrhizobium sp. SZCCHNRI1002 TaxID=3057274 RepID=UPI0028E19255|nr:hypothetical protein [Bradyrhizobium sp. SZCCHNRI1002]